MQLSEKRSRTVSVNGDAADLGIRETLKNAKPGLIWALFHAAPALQGSGKGVILSSWEPKRVLKYLPTLLGNGDTQYVRRQREDKRTNKRFLPRL